MKQAHDKHEFLKENKYIHLDLLELQEMLIKAGYLMPDEKPIADNKQRLTVGSLGMEAAVEVFYDFALNHYPQVLSPQYQ